MSDNKLHLGYGKLSGNVYLGKQLGNHWVGPKRDVTSEFIEVMLRKFEPNTSHIISIDGKNKYRVIVVDLDKVVTVNGKDVTDEK